MRVHRVMATHPILRRAGERNSKALSSECGTAALGCVPWERQSPDWRGHRLRRAVSLIELLVCVLIILILTGISLTYHQGALDSSDLRYVMPKVEKALRLFQGVSGAVDALLTVEFVKGQPTMQITLSKGAPVPPVEFDISILSTARLGDMDLLAETIRNLIPKDQESYRLVGNWNLKDAGILKRKLVFMNYLWPEGNKTPRTFTFIPHGRPQGGTVEFGSIYATAELKLVGDSPVWSMK